MREPTAKQRQAYEAVIRLGSQVAAARELGVSQGAVRSALLGYMTALDIRGAIPGAGRKGGRPPGYSKAAFAVLEDRIRMLEEQVAMALAERDAALAERDEAIAQTAPFLRLEAKLDQLLARPVIVASSRRITDGGEGEKHQRRRLAREHRAA